MGVYIGWSAISILFLFYFIFLKESYRLREIGGVFAVVTQTVEIMIVWKNKI